MGLKTDLMELAITGLQVLRRGLFSSDKRTRVISFE